MLTAHSVLGYAISHTVYTETKREKSTHRLYIQKLLHNFALLQPKEKTKGGGGGKKEIADGETCRFFPFSQAVQRGVGLTSMVISNCPVLQISKADLLVL